MPSRVAFSDNCRISCLGQPTPNSDMEDDDGDLTCLSNYSYHKLPAHLLKLSILKLDGTDFVLRPAGDNPNFNIEEEKFTRAFNVDTCLDLPALYDVVIEKNSSVGELKHAIEDVFSSTPDEGQGEISWSHVWGHFCLSFGDQKLLNDRTYIMNIGIRDGDQLQFVHHLSINYSPKKRRAKNSSPIQTPRSSGSAASGDEEELFDESEFRLSHMVRGWLPSRRPKRFGGCGGTGGMVRL